MNLIFRFIILVTVVSLLFVEGHLKITKPTVNKLENKTTMLEDDHFFSNTSKQETFSIAGAETNRPLVTTIAPRKKGDAYKNPVTLILKSGTQNITCQLKSYEDLCVLEKVPAIPPLLTIKCRDLPCQVQFTTSQSPLLQTLSQQQLDELYKMDDQIKHHVMMFSCNDPDVKNYESMLRVYTNQPFTRTFTNNVIYYLFTNTGKGYMLVQSDQKARRCTTMSVSKTPNSLQNGILVRDFVTKNVSSFDIATPKDMDVRIDLSYHQLDRTKVVKSQLSVQLFGLDGSNKKSLHKFVIQNLDNQSNIIADTVFPKSIFSNYTRLNLQFTSSQTLLLVTITINYAKVHQIDPDQISLFTLKKGEILTYKLQAEPKNDDKKVQIQLINQNNHAAVSVKTCGIRQGCQFKVNTTEDIKQAAVRLVPLGKKKQNKVSYLTIDSTYSGKIREGQLLYFVHVVKNKTDVEIMVNSPNVLIYAADKNCPKPSQTCNNYSGNNKQQIEIQQKYVGQLYITVEGLDNSRFTLRVIENSAYLIELKDGQPFSYTLKQQNDIGFTFKIKDYNSDVKFNLIAPLNYLNMYVNNDAEEITVGNANLISYSGDVVFRKSDLKSNDFTILLSKIHKTSNSSVHFTLIASTTTSILPLQPSIAHYQQLQYHEPVKFILQYNRKTTTLLNIYFSDVASDAQLPIIMKVVHDLKQLPNAQQIEITKMRQTIDLQEYGSDLCKSTTIDYCQLYLQFVNNGQLTLDMTLTLLSRDAIVQLKDGIWQSFPIKQITSSFHFYFMPKHQNNSINIMYKSTYKHLQLIYKLWAVTSDKFINIQDWPFPNMLPSNETKNEVFNPIQSITISSDNLKKCWPNCVVLFSFLKPQESNTTGINSFMQRLAELDHVNILASNDIISLIQREKIQLVLHKDEQKELIIDLKHILDKEHITFFSYTIIGSVRMFASLSSNQNNRRPTQTSFDFTFGQLQTQLNIGKIKDTLNSLNIENDQQIYLKIVVFPQMESKITFEYSTRQNKIKQLQFESFETLSLAANQEKLIQLLPTNDYKLKIVRAKGFPFISVKQCSNKDLNDCIQDMTDSALKQMTSKTEEHQGKMSTDKIVVLKIVAKQDVEIDVYAQTPFGQLELKQGSIVTDFSLANQTVRYSITGIRLMQTVLTVNVLQGNPTVRVYDFDGVNITRTKKPNGLIHIPIPPKAVNRTISPINMAYGFGLNSIFSSVHVSVSDNQTNTFYTIQYTSGQRGLMMQDGLLSTVVIDASKNITFFYRNTVLQQEPIVIITAETSEQLKALEIKISYLKQDSEGEQMHVQTPQFKAKTPRPTMLFRLPKGYVDYQIFLINKSPKINSSVSVVINQDQVLILPYNIEYPVILKDGESQYLMTQINNDGSLVLSVKKCDAGVPTIAYSFDKNAFASQDYTFESQIKQQMRAEYFIKGQQGTLYLKIAADVASSFSVTLNYYPNKSSIPKDLGHPGNHGMLEYELVNSIQAEISFHPIQCDNKSACPKVTYSYMAATSLQSVYSQSLCPSYFFTFSEQNKPLESKAIKVSDKSPNIKFSYKLIDQISYVTVKAVAQNGKQYIYKPVQIVTIWGHIARNKNYHIFFIFIIGGLIVCSGLMAFRRWTRPQYKRLQDEVQ